jgi:hypothetical protein
VFAPLQTDYTCINTAQGTSGLGQRDSKKKPARRIAKDRVPAERRGTQKRPKKMRATTRDDPANTKEQEERDPTPALTLPTQGNSVLCIGQIDTKEVVRHIAKDR